VNCHLKQSKLLFFDAPFNLEMTKMRILTAVPDELTLIPRPFSWIIYRVKWDWKKRGEGKIRKVKKEERARGGKEENDAPSICCNPRTSLKCSLWSER